jgi:lambda repressor-like predicted transcriptional regulator
MLKAKRIKMRLLERGVSQAAIAADQKVDRSYVNHVIANRSKNRRIREAVADACGWPISYIWPEEKNTQRAA